MRQCILFKFAGQPKYMLRPTLLVNRPDDRNMHRLTSQRYIKLGLANFQSGFRIGGKV